MRSLPFPLTLIRGTTHLQATAAEAALQENQASAEHVEAGREALPTVAKKISAHKIKCVQWVIQCLHAKIPKGN